MKPILVGMNNPQGNKPLFPWPPNCTGWRIWQMVGCTRREYLDSFDRINMVEGTAWCPVAARANRRAIAAILEGRTAVLLGRAVGSALGLPATAWMVPTWLGHGGVYYVLPHPSGLNRWYNDSANHEAAASFLRGLYSDYRQSAGLPLTSGSVAA